MISVPPQKHSCVPYLSLIHQSWADFQLLICCYDQRTDLKLFESGKKTPPHAASVFLKDILQGLLLQLEIYPIFYN